MTMKESVRCFIFFLNIQVELQLSEFQSMKQTISDLEINFQSIRQQYVV